MSKKVFTIVWLSAIIFLYNSYIFSSADEIHAFRSYSSPKMEKMRIIGKVIAKTKSLSSQRRKVLNYDAREMILSARLYSREELRLGDKVFIIEKDPNHRKYKNGYIIGEAVVYSLFRTEFQGWMLKAKGNISMVSSGHFIAIRDQKNARREAILLNKKGEKYEYIQDDSKAIYYYKKSLKKDPERPETYMQLALLYSRKGSFHLALNYLNNAWSRLNRYEKINDAFLLPGYYLQWNLKDIESKSSNVRDILKLYLKLKNDALKMERQLTYFKEQLRPGVYSMIKNKGIPDARYQYYYGFLLERIYDILNRQPLTRIIRWLNEEERNFLYEPVHIIVNNQKVYLKPRKLWEKAYFESSLFHYRLAIEINQNHENAMFRIVYLASQGLKSGNIHKVERYKDFIEYYGRRFLDLSDNSFQINFVRARLNTLDQL